MTKKKTNDGTPPTSDTPTKGVGAFLKEFASNQFAFNMLMAKKCGLTVPNFGDSTLKKLFEAEVNYIVQYALLEARAEKSPNPLELSNPQVVMEPCFMIILWDGLGPRLTSQSLRDDFGVKGPFILSLIEQIGGMWPNAERSAIKNFVSDYTMLAQNFLSLRGLVKSQPPPTDETADQTELLVKEFFKVQRKLVKRH